MCAFVRAFERSLCALTTVRFVGVVRIGSRASKRNETKRSDSLATPSIDLVKKKKKDDDDENVRNVESVREKRGEARMWGGGVDGWW